MSHTQIFLLKLSILLYLCLSVFNVQGQSSTHKGQLCEGHDHVSDAGLTFVENQNQWHPNIKYASELGGLNYVYLEDKAFTYVLLAEEETRRLHDIMKESDEIQENHMVPGHAYKVHFSNALTPEFKGHQKRSGYNNYFLGNDPTNWEVEVPAYHEVIYEDAYPNIQLSTYSQNGNFKYDFIVAANGDPTVIELLYEGMDAIYLEEGNLDY